MTTKALNELPLSKLIQEPLSAAAKAHLEISNANLEALINIASQPNQQFKFTSQFPPGGDGGGNPAPAATVVIDAPLVSLVDIPSFAITKIENNFSFEVSTIQEDLESKKGSLKGSASAGGLISKFVDFNLEAGYEKSASSRNTYNEKGKLNIHVTAVKVDAPKGLQTIIDAAIESITAQT
ncbi:DUF2589 domain-containing protein [Paraglaciecola chathamensis]|uniref:DUF2589 domain-containing protein n=1 Tax=Paraglaciecola chathamensis TaxID=368405 RepID=UPI00270CC3A6|nr:DUF2589 domain-containing protein [Paraglaciecola chathamensis]MDO6557617.1 DUF2589 domain-containing protein [Paraglaciecola chathamensis]